MSAVRERPQGLVEVRWRQTPGFVRFLSFDVRLGQDPGGCLTDPDMTGIEDFDLGRSRERGRGWCQRHDFQVSARFARPQHIAKEPANNSQAIRCGHDCTGIAGGLGRVGGVSVLYPGGVAPEPRAERGQSILLRCAS